MAEENTTHFVEGFALSGDFVKNLKDKHFTIIDVPVYEESKDLDNPEKMKRKLTCTVELADKQHIKWFPNKTSQKSIIAKKGYVLEGWVGYQGEFYTESRKVLGNMRDIIFIKD